jgi:methylmalonyl-CoA/ethylmalonyl-CoA epimerase
MIENIDRVVIAVKDLEKSIDFFSDLLDIEFDEIGGGDEVGMKGTNSSFGLELLAPTSEDTVVGKFIKNRGEGLFALVIKVSNLDEAVEKFKKKGLEPAGVINIGKMREVVFHSKDSHGTQIILAEYPEMHPGTVAAKHPDLLP